MSLFDDANKKSETVGLFNAHPVGRYAGLITEIKAGEWDGTRNFEIQIQTNAGKAKQTIWQTLEADVTGRLLARHNGNAVAAQQAYIDGMARTLYLFNITGLPRPTTEQAVYQSLGQLKGKQVTIEVKKNPKDDRNPYVNLYPIADLEKTTGKAAAPSNGASDWAGEAASSPLSAPSAQVPLDQIPF